MRHVPPEEGPRADPGHGGEIIYLGWPGNALMFHQTTWRPGGRGEESNMGCRLEHHVRASILRLLCDLATDKWKVMDGCLNSICDLDL